MANEFVARKGLIVSGSTRMTDSLEVDTSISASSFTGSFIGDGSGLTGIDGFPFTGSAEISGSLNVDGPITASFFVGDGSGLTGVDGFPFTGSAEISGSLDVDGPVTASFFVGDGSGLTNVTAELTTVTTFGQPFTSETSITVTHNLDTNTPLVQVYDDSGEQIIPTKIKILNNDEVLIEFPVEVSGTVVVGKGGDLVQSPIQQYAETFISESSVVINHLLDTDSPIVQVYDLNDEQIIPQKIKILDTSSVLIEFPIQITGKVVVAKGGHIIDAVGLSYVAQDFTDTSLVSVTHSFGTDAPIVQVYSDTGLQIIPQEIRIIDQDALEVEFSSNRSGKIAVSKGGHIIQGTGGGILDPSGSFTGSFSGSFIGDGSGLSGIDGFPFTGSAEISGSLEVVGPVTASFFVGDGSGLTGIDLTGTTVYAESFVSESSILIIHNLDTLAPIVQVYDENDEQIIPFKIKIVDSDSILLEFSPETTGNVVIAKAGHIIETSGLTYKVQDFNNTDNVIVNHGFDTLAPIVQVYDDTGSQILPDDIRVLDENSVEIIFSENYSGKVAVSKGGHIVTTENGTSGSFTGSFTATEDIIPSVTDQFDLGSPTNRFKDIYLSGSTIFLGNIKLSESEDGNLKVVDASEKEFSIIEIDTGSINSRLDDLENFSSSLDDTFATDDELFATQSLLQGDIDTRLLTSSFNEYTGSTDIRIDNLEIESGSIRSALNNYTSSADLRLGSLEIESGSVRTDFSNYTSSADLRLDSLEAESGSIRGTFNNFTSSVDGALTFNNEDIVAKGNITVTGDLLVQGTQSIFNTEQFSVENNVIELNTAGAIKGGILVGDITEPSELSGSLLWDGVNDHWIAGISGSEQRIILENTFNNYTSSIDTKISSLETESGSIRNVFNSYTSSTDLRLGALETESGSIRTTFNNFTGSLGNIVTQNSSSITITGGSINDTSIGGTSASTGAFTDLSYTGTLTGGTGVVNIGSGQFYKDVNGNVGIGTSDPIRVLSVHGDGEVFGSSRTMLQVADSGAQAAGRGGGIAFTGNSTDGILNGNSWFATIQGFKENSTSGNTASAMAFSTRTSGDVPTERMRITSAGVLLVGMTADAAQNVGSRLFPSGVVTGTRDGDVAGIFNRLSSNGDVVLFRRQTLPVGSVSVTTTATSYNTSAASGITGVDANTVAVRTNSTERLRIDSAGNVGIGTTTPLAKLDISGQHVSSIGLLRLTSSTTTEISAITYYQSNEYRAATFVSDNNDFIVWARGTSNIVFSTANSITERMRITNTGNVLPGANATQDLGSSSLRWNTVYTSDLSLKNDLGDWTIVEGEDDLFLYNNTKGKVYKFALQEVDPSIAPPKRS